MEMDGNTVVCHLCRAVTLQATSFQSRLSKVLVVPWHPFSTTTVGSKEGICGDWAEGLSDLLNQSSSVSFYILHFTSLQKKKSLKPTTLKQWFSQCSTHISSSRITQHPTQTSRQPAQRPTSILFQQASQQL